MTAEERTTLTIGSWVLLLLLVATTLLAWGCPHYNVYTAEKQGEAALRRAEQDRRIRVAEAQANLESEELNAQAEVARARGMAEAMDIENGELTELYNQYLFIRSLERMAEKGSLPMIIYLPAETGLPILEASRLSPEPARAPEEP